MTIKIYTYLKRPNERIKYIDALIDLPFYAVQLSVSIVRVYSEASEAFTFAEMQL